MASFFRTIFYLIFFFGLSGCGKTTPDPEPEDPPVDPPNGEYKGSFRWNFINGAEGFSKSTGEACAFESEFLLWQQKADVYLSSPEKLHLPADKYQTVELRMAGTATTLKLYWKKESDAALQTVSIPLISDGKIHDYQIELGQNIHWTGFVEQFLFQTDINRDISIDFIKLTGIYFVPFPGLTFDLETDAATLNELKDYLSVADKSVVVGYSSLTEYLALLDGNGDYLYYRNTTGHFNPYYLVELAKVTNMPVMIWLRGDPWGFSHAGMYQQLFADNNNLMWKADINANPAYRSANSGYAYLCLAQEDLDGKTPLYWQQTDKLLGQCAEIVGKLIRENPDCILGVTTNAEYKFNAENQTIDLDYNPKTIREFRDYCKQKYGNISTLNMSCGTSFATFDLRSTDFNPVTVENENGFDAPRTRGTPLSFWNEWKTFRAQQIHRAVTRHVEIIAQHIDSKYIYTHQVGLEADPFCSPAFCANVQGSNVGSGAEGEKGIQELASFVKSDPARSWGIPEMCYYKSQNPDPAKVLNELKMMHKLGVKYLGPMPWSFDGGDIDLKGTATFSAMRDFLKDIN